MKQPLWTPSEYDIKSSILYGFQQFVEQRYNRCFLDYGSFHHWSVERIEDLWEAILYYFNIDFSGSYDQVLRRGYTVDDFIDVKWFEGISLSYVEHIFREKPDTGIAIKYGDEEGNYLEISWAELRRKVSSIQQFLKEKDIQKGDRVAGILNNNVETIAIFLAVNSLGAMWSCCSPHFGDKSITERFEQIEPKALFIELDYQYNGKSFSKQDTLTHIQNHISSIKT